MIILTLDDLENGIIEFCFNLTGMKPKEINTTDKYILKLGIFQPLEIVFIKKNHNQDTDFRRSSYIKMLEILVSMLKNEPEFLIWINLNKTKQ